MGANGRRGSVWSGDGFGVVDRGDGGTERGQGIAVPRLERGGEAEPQRTGTVRVSC